MADDEQPGSELAPSTQQQYAYRPYLVDTYQIEHVAGLRNPNGSQRLQKLSPEHKKIIALHLGGVPSKDIVNHVECGYSTVIRVLSDPLAKEVIAQMDALYEEEFQRMRGLANEALRKAMNPEQPISTQLKAVAIYDKRSLATEEKEEKQTAEDVMMGVLQRIEADNVQINFNLSDKG